MQIQEPAQRILTCDFKPVGPNPSLFFDAERVAHMRRRVESDPELAKRFRDKADELVGASPEDAREIEPRQPANEAVSVAEGYLLFGEAHYADWAKRRIATLLGHENWMYAAHREFCFHCDHVMCNVAAAIAIAHDLLGPAYTAEETQEIGEKLYHKVYKPFMGATEDRAEWWAAQDMESNWKIMCCGEGGLGFCGFAHHMPECREGMARAAQGVWEVLDLVAPEGDWPEGVGYWFGTLFYGLRYARALRRLTQGEVNLFEHPALQVTPDYAVMMTSGSGYTFNFNDNGSDIGGTPGEAVRMLAVETGRPDWLHLARQIKHDSVLWLAIEDQTAPSAPPDRLMGRFPRTGVASLRNGWSPQDTFIGFKCGPSNVGHAHLDAGTFVVESQGTPLLIDEGVPPYSFYLGFWDFQEGLRWNFDRLGTPGHNTILVDGQGQSWGPDCAGKLLESQTGPGWQMVAGDASRCYPETLTKFTRTILFLLPDTIVVRDVIGCQGTHHLEWLLHYAGEIEDAGFSSIVKNDDLSLTVTPFLPDRGMGWRVNDCTRTSYYKGDPGAKDMNIVPIRYRSFAPFRAAESCEFLFGMTLGEHDAETFWQFSGEAGDWRLTIPTLNKIVSADKDGLTVVEA